MTYFDQTTEPLPREQLAALQLDKFQAMSRELWGRNRFYTDKWTAAGMAPGDLRSLADLARLPLTTKHELMEDQAAHGPFGHNLTYPVEQYVRFHQTSGTTGVPLKVPDTEAGWQWWGRCWGHVLAGAGVTKADRLFMAFSFGPFVGFWAATEGARQLGAMMIPGGGRDSPQRLELMREVGASVLCCTPTYALRLAEVAREIGFDLSTIPMKATVHAGEPGANVPSTKARIEEAWNAKCHDHAGATEVGAHSFECEVQPGGTHLIESEYIAEILDPATGKPVAEGERGELVLTNLGRWGFPVVRYRTGDIVRTTTQRCDCGRTALRLDRLRGRTDDMVIFKGVNFYPRQVETVLLRQAGVSHEYQIVLDSAGGGERMTILVETEPGCDPAVAARVRRELHVEVVGVGAAAVDRPGDVAELAGDERSLDGGLP